MEIYQFSIFGTETIFEHFFDGNFKIEPQKPLKCLDFGKKKPFLNLKIIEILKFKRQKVETLQLMIVSLLEFELKFFKFQNIQILRILGQICTKSS